MILSLVATAERLGENAYEYLKAIIGEHGRDGRVTTRLPLPSAALPAPT